MSLHSKTGIVMECESIANLEFSMDPSVSDRVQTHGKRGECYNVQCWLPNLDPQGTTNLAHTGRPRAYKLGMDAGHTFLAAGDGRARALDVLQP